LGELNQNIKGIREEAKFGLLMAQKECWNLFNWTRIVQVRRVLLLVYL